MKELIGSPGMVSGLLLRIGQFLCAAASIGVMVSAKGFSNYTAFCYLIASMGLQVLWSFGLACLDVYALRIKRDLQNPVLVSLFVVGDWVTATLSLAAACSSAGIAVLYAKDLDFCKISRLERVSLGGSLYSLSTFRFVSFSKRDGPRIILLGRD